LRWLTQEEITRVLEACAKSKNKELGAAVIIVPNTGLRRGELIGLTTVPFSGKSRGRTSAARAGSPDYQSGLETLASFTKGDLGQASATYDPHPRRPTVTRSCSAVSKSVP